MYLIEPYNAYQKPAKKKHWHEIAEEEALFVKMMEAKAAQQTQADSVNDGSPSLSTAATPAVGAAGAGGTPPRLFFNPAEFNVTFSLSQITGPAPLTITFANNTTEPFGAVNSYLWNFGDGTTSTLRSPSHTFSATQSYDITLTVTNSLNQARTISATGLVSASIPSLVADFTSSTVTGAIPLPITFSNSTTYNGSGTLTYLWNFGDSTSSVLLTPSHSYARTGSYTVTLQVTESLFNLTSLKTKTNYISASA